MNAWSADAVQPKYLEDKTPLQRQGAIVFQQMQCRNCHALGGIGGRRGPDLVGVSTRMTEDQLVRQVLQGSGNMPAFGSTLSPQQTTALVSFLETLNDNQIPAQNDARRLINNPSAQPHHTQ